MSASTDILSIFITAVLFYILGRGMEKMKWIEKVIDMDRLQRFFKKEKGIFEDKSENNVD